MLGIIIVSVLVWAMLFLFFIGVLYKSNKLWPMENAEIYDVPFALIYIQLFLIDTPIIGCDIVTFTSDLFVLIASMLYNGIKIYQKS